MCTGKNSVGITGGSEDAYRCESCADGVLSKTRLRSMASWTFCGRLPPQSSVDGLAFEKRSDSQIRLRLPNNAKGNYSVLQ